MENARASHDAKGSMQAHLAIEQLINAVSIVISLHISKIANVADLVIRTCMGVTMRVVVGASSDTALAQVTKLVDMEAMFLPRLETRESSCDESPCVRVLLFKFDNTPASLVGLRVEDANCTARLRG